MEGKQSFVTITWGMRGYFAILLSWNPEHGGFYEPWCTGFGSYGSVDEAEPEAKIMAQCENLEYRRPPPEQHDDHVWAYRRWLTRLKVIEVRQRRLT